jgi:hypothetical protein
MLLKLIRQNVSQVSTQVKMPATVVFIRRGVTQKINQHTYFIIYITI